MKDTEKTDNKGGGLYSRKRLALLAVAWLFVGVVTLATTGVFVVESQDPAGCPNQNGPCAFPAESNVGGIILGTTYIEGQNLIAFGVGAEPALTADTPPDAVTPEENQIILGLNDLTAQNFFIYKSFHYFDERVGERVPVNIWANATQATLSGSADQCGDGTPGPDGSEYCDLQAGTSELTTSYLEATGVNNGCSGTTCSLVPNTIQSQQFWAVRPEDDVCGAAGALAGTICLGLVTDGGTSAAGATITTDGVTVSAADFIVRGHEYEAVEGPNGNGATKTMSLDNVYVEMRYGVGDDRVNTPISDPPAQTPSGASIPQGTYWAQPYNTTTTPSYQYGPSGLAIDFQCLGGGPLTNCVIPPEYASDQGGVSYNNPHIPSE